MTTYPIRKNYSKLMRPLGTGYDHRSGGQKPTHVILHTTNGRKGSQFAGEATFLQNSKDVGCHYLVSKKVEYGIEEICPPAYRPWHAGNCIPGISNNNTIGIEVHFSIGDTWTKFQYDAITYLAIYLKNHHGIPYEHWITHRAAAVPPGRKIDPSGMTDAQFRDWKASLPKKEGNAPKMETYVLGVEQMATLDACVRSMQRNYAALSTDEMGRFYQMCEWLQVDASFVLACWAMEGGLPYGSTNLQQQSRNPVNIREPATEWRPYVRYGNGTFMKFESFQLGLLEAVLFIKNTYGQQGMLTVEHIMANWPPMMEPDQQRRVERVLETMDYIQKN